MFTPGIPQLAIFALIVLVLFGNRLPGVMRNLGKSMNMFKAGLNDAVAEDEPTAAPAADAAPKAAVEDKTPTAA